MLAKTRTTIVALAASLSFAGAALAPAASQALPVQETGGFSCYHNGVEYKDGATITVNGRMWHCVNGIWTTSSYLMNVSQPSAAAFA